MKNNSPKVIFACKFTYGKNNPDNYLKKVFSNYSIYLKDDVLHLTDYFSDKKKEIVGMIDYYSGIKQEKEVNLILENGQYATQKQKVKLEQDLLKATENSNLWKGIVSFNNDWINQKITIKELEQIFAKDVLPKFFKKCGFENVKKMRYCFSLHGNTDNLHIHFAFVEKEPNFINRDGKVLYRRKGQLTKGERDFLKNETIIAIERKSLVSPMITELNKEIDELKKYFNPNEKNFILRNINDIRMEEKIIELGFLINEYRENNDKKIKYGSIKNNNFGKRIKLLTNQVKYELFHNYNSDLYKQQKNVENSLKRLNDYYEELNQQNHIETKVKNNELILSKEKYVDSFIMNSIVNHALYKTSKLHNIVKSKSSKNKILLNDLIQELAFEKSQKYIGQNIKMLILKNNICGKSYKEKNKFKHEISMAIKKINFEMKEYAKDFHELFVDSNYKK